MKSPWSLRDYVFSAFMTIGMVASIFLVGPFVPVPFLDLVIWAPFGGIFLTLGMARLQRRGSVALMILPLALLMLPLSPLITLYLVLTPLTAEAVVFFRGNYRSKANRLLGTVVFFMSGVLIGLGSIFAVAALVNAGTIPAENLAKVLEKFADLLNKPWLVGVLAVAAGIMGSIGWWLGEKVVHQLQRAGKLDADA
ncbi:hypothetical protein C1752_11496 [Acaryochloris thomasi RCC1774]|uniref:Uncharacterized protein n=1 Tax=Acaryochloris thomasi RCC1774 TaxID=1764569 RepID=A0A2W1JJQ5_9CYAN|nr:MptD family putative ECF transporter S component [Acaryochloris thomasi]PZD70494.1 hypothetical protein C1752_11496 [Acaryochloris thomasi RCC1774]